MLALSIHAPPSSGTQPQTHQRADTPMLRERRHDNDYEHIKDIRILPTFDEVASSREPYLPLADPRSWHKSGFQGLLDRHFRLLREESTYKIRRRLRAEFQKRKDGFGVADWSDDVGTSFNVDLKKFKLHPTDGVQLVASMPQPKGVSGSLESYWRKSRNLRPGALVCLLTSDKKMLYCKVCMPPPRDEDKYREIVAPWLFANKMQAEIKLEAIDIDAHFIADMLDLAAYSSRSTTRYALIDFPNEMIPSFYNTLVALKNMSTSRQTTFAEYLGRTEGTAPSIKPPAFASAKNFTYDLAPILQTHQSLRFSPLSSTANAARQLQAATTLDASQAQTVIDVLSRRLALLQGPPGTGKSYVGVQLIKVLAAARYTTRSGPIVCVCWTNHALDQLLEHLLDAGLSKIVRFGSRSKSERIQALYYKEVFRNSKPAGGKRIKAVKAELKHHGGVVDDRLIQALDNELAQHIASYLRAQHPERVAQLLNGRPDHVNTGSRSGDSRASRDSLADAVKDWRAGVDIQSTTTSRGASTPRPQGPMFQMAMSDRRTLCQAWEKDMVARARYDSCMLAEPYVAARKEWKAMKDDGDNLKLQTMDIIGMTTSGLMSHRSKLERLGCKIIVCEEAGEVLEAHLLASMLSSLEHLILIGDHLQLRPHLDAYHLSSASDSGRDIALDVSLFERLVSDARMGGCKLPFSILRTQRRMHPDIANLVRTSLYPQLLDSPPQRVYAPIKGFARRLFWLDHAHAESSGRSGTHSNTFEVEMIVALTKYILQQGQFKPEDIAVITPYVAQLQKLQTALSAHVPTAIGSLDVTELRKIGMGAGAAATNTGVRIATVDNFQGEESKVILVSLVRSNNVSSCGFMSANNRINVLLSRAQHAMYIIGNAGTFEHIEMWSQVIEELVATGSLAPSITLQCPRHPSLVSEVFQPKQLPLACPAGGCTLPCLLPTKCGHYCPSSCHAEHLHAKMTCTDCRKGVPVPSALASEDLQCDASTLSSIRTRRINTPIPVQRAMRDVLSHKNGYHPPHTREVRRMPATEPASSEGHDSSSSQAMTERELYALQRVQANNERAAGQIEGWYADDRRRKQEPTSHSRRASVASSRSAGSRSSPTLTRAHLHDGGSPPRERQASVEDSTSGGPSRRLVSYHDLDETPSGISSSAYQGAALNGPKADARDESMASVNQTALASTTPPPATRSISPAQTPYRSPAATRPSPPAQTPGLGRYRSVSTSSDSDLEEGEIRECSPPPVKVNGYKASAGHMLPADAVTGAAKVAPAVDESLSDITPLFERLSIKDKVELARSRSVLKGKPVPRALPLQRIRPAVTSAMDDLMGLEF